MWQRALIALLVTFPLLLVAKERVVKNFPGGQYIAYEDGKPVDYWRVIDGYQIRIKDLVLEGRKFSVIIINQREGYLRQTPPIDAVATDPSLNYVPAIFSYIRHFVRTSYDKRFGDKAMSVINQERDFLNGVSNMVVVTEHNNLAKILGTFRNVHRGNLPENQKLDLETTLHIDLPESWTENKTLVKDPDAPASLYEFLWVLQDDYGFYEHSNRRVIVNGEEKLLVPTHVAHEAAPAQRRYYRMTLKFQPHAENENVQWHTLPDLKVQMQRMREKLGDDYKRFNESPSVFGWNRVPVYFKEFIDTRLSSTRPKPLRAVTLTTGISTGFFNQPLRQTVQFSHLDSTGMPDLTDVRHPSPLWDISINPSNIPFYRERDTRWLRELEDYREALRKLDRENGYNFFNLLPVMPSLKSQLPRLSHQSISNPFHPTDIFVRLGLGYDSTDGVIGMGEFQRLAHQRSYNLHFRFNSSGDPGRTGPNFGVPIWKGADVNSQDMRLMAEERDRLMAQYLEEERLQLFDSRLEDDVLLTDRERILRVLTFPSYFFSDISWAVDNALKYYFDDPEFQLLFVKWIQASLLEDYEVSRLGIGSYEEYQDIYRLARQNPIELGLKDQNSRAVLALIEIRKAKSKIDRVLEEKMLTAPGAIKLIKHSIKEWTLPLERNAPGMPPHLVIASLLAKNHPDLIGYALDGILRKTHFVDEQKQMVQNIREVYEEWKKSQLDSRTSINDFIVSIGLDPNSFLVAENPPRRISWRFPSSAREATVRRIREWWPEFAHFLDNVKPAFEVAQPQCRHFLANRLNP